MKTNQMSYQQALERMGSNVSVYQAKAMLRLLQRSQFVDTDDISDEVWFQLVGVACESTETETRNMGA